MDQSGSATSARKEVTLASGARIVVELAGVTGAPECVAAAMDAVAQLVLASQSQPAREDDVRTSYGGIVGASAPMRDMFRMLERIRASNATILITGENGTGKELVARAIHQQSNRANRRFVATNCSAFNDNLLESEMFGHKRGAFTGAVADKPGLFEVADGGTLFLDEVGDMSAALQVKLLRVLQEGTFTPVGATESKKVDVRIIAATNRDLSALVAQGVFREDLFYRLHVVALKVPALRERPSDIPLLVQTFVARLSARDGRQKTVSARVMERLVGHRWPGNVRELENEIERMWVLSGNDTVIGAELLSPSIVSTPSSVGQLAAAALPSAAVAPSQLDEGAARGGPEPRLPDAVEALERRMIVDGLRRARGNKTRAAEELGISRRNLIRKVQAYRIGDDNWRHSGAPVDDADE